MELKNLHAKAQNLILGVVMYKKQEVKKIETSETFQLTIKKDGEDRQIEPSYDQTLVSIIKCDKETSKECGLKLLTIQSIDTSVYQITLKPTLSKDIL